MDEWVLEYWPINADGEADETVLLGNETEFTPHLGLCASALEACGVPHFSKEVEGKGADLYVPESYLDYAREMIDEAVDSNWEKYEEDEL